MRMIFVTNVETEQDENRIYVFIDYKEFKNGFIEKLTSGNLDYSEISDTLQNSETQKIVFVGEHKHNCGDRGGLRGMDIAAGDIISLPYEMDGVINYSSIDAILLNRNETVVSFCCKLDII